MRFWLVQTGEELPLDGPETRLLRTALLAEELCRRGHEVIFFNASFNHQRKVQRSNKTTIISKDPAAGRNYTCVLLAGRAYQSNVSYGRYKSHRENALAFLEIAPDLPVPDAILIGLPPIELAEAATGFAKDHDIPCAVDCRDMWPEVIEERLPVFVRSFARMALKGLYRQRRRALMAANAITGITTEFVEWGNRSAGREKSEWDRPFHLAVSPTPIDPAMIESAAEQWHQTIGFLPQDEPKPVIGCFAGTFAKRLDLVSIVDGANALSDNERSKIRLVLCGLGDLHEEISSMASGNSSIIIPGWRNASEIAALMQQSDFGILPYPNTPDFMASFPNKVGEYLLAGLPILTGLNGMTGAILDEEGLALRYQVGDAGSVTNALTALIKQRPSAQLSEHARKAGKEYFDPARIYPAFVEWLEQLSAINSGDGLQPVL